MAPSLNALLEAARRDYRSRRAAAEAQVKSWRAATFSILDPRPWYHERSKLGLGRWLKEVPRSPHEGQVDYGFDAQDRVVVERTYSGIVRDGERWRYERFWSWGDGYVDLCCYDYAPEKPLISAARMSFGPGGRPARWEVRFAGSPGAQREAYVYDGDVLRRVEEEIERPNGVASEPPRHDRYEFLHDAEGLVQILWSTAVGSEVVWKRRSAPKKEAATDEAFVTALVENVRAAVRKLAPREPIYSLVLAYDDEGNDPLPPSIGVGLASEREEWLRNEEDAAWLLWNPAEYRHYARGPLEANARVRKLASALNAERVSERGRARSMRLINRAVSELRRTRWPRSVQRTPDFVVYAIDYELVAIDSVLRKAAGAKQFAAWKKNGWLPE